MLKQSISEIFWRDDCLAIQLPMLFYTESDSKCRYDSFDMPIDMRTCCVRKFRTVLMWRYMHKDSHMQMGWMGKEWRRIRAIGERSY